MFKLIKILVLLGIVIGGGVWLYVYSQSKRAPDGVAAKELRSKEADKPRLEEKYGFTSEGAGGP